jgi:phosphatidylethanolamine N-methyltransferase
VRRALIGWVKEYKIFDPDYNPSRYAFIRRQLTNKMGDDYEFSKVPIEYNTWLLFRRLVDLILINDFVSYTLFAIAWCHFPQGHSWVIHTLRWIAGWILAAFNVWVKMDAHRVVKDFAWYWGDFFFLVDQSLTFDGVFEMAPHPMYSVGYAFYYGVSIMTASYTVLFTSLLAHAAQFAFLVLVENPHIDKTYNAAPTRRSDLSRSPYAKPTITEEISVMTSLSPNSPSEGSPDSYRRPMTASQPNRDLIVFYSFDPYRSADLSLLVICFYTILTLFLTRGVSWGPTFIVVQSVVWRLLHSVGLGLILRMQSSDKFWTKHFIKHGSNPIDAWSQWKSLYNTSLCLTYVSFILACLQNYQLPNNWTYGTVLLRHTLGFILIGLHTWTSYSIHEVLGDFGWFFGDFFVEGKNKLTYTGIYRYLNNPERLMGSAAFWGMSLITSSTVAFSLALLAQVCNLLFIQLVEKYPSWRWH